MTLQNLRYVIEIANSKSFSKAAQSLFMTQSALSTAIRDLEEELGITIFKRTNRGVMLTADGEDCLKYCKEIIERADYLTMLYQGRKTQRASFSVSAQHLPFAVRAFDELLSTLEPTGFDVAIRETETLHILHDISTGRSEIGVVAITKKQLALMNKSLYIQDIHFEPLAQLNTYVIRQCNAEDGGVPGRVERQGAKPEVSRLKMVDILIEIGIGYAQMRIEKGVTNVLGWDTIEHG